MINNHEELIKDLTDRCKAIIGPNFNFKKNRYNSLFHYVIEGTEEVENYKKGAVNLVKALHWFDSFWLFMEVRLRTASEQKHRNAKHIIIQTSISISVYHNDNVNKTQLFRAEWDDFSDGNSNNHPQPHWHITFNNQESSSFAEFVKEYGDDDFLSLLESENKSQLNIKNMHFAMSSRWHLGEDCTSQIDDKTKVINWVVGLLNHIESELKYIVS